MIVHLILPEAKTIAACGDRSDTITAGLANLRDVTCRECRQKGKYRMMNKRHLTQTEKQIIVAIIEDAGAVEVLRLLGSVIENDHPDIDIGTGYRSRIFKIAKDIDFDAETEK